MRSRSDGLTKPASRIQHQAMTAEALAALGALIQPHADADSHAFEDGAGLFAPHSWIIGRFCPDLKGGNGIGVLAWYWQDVILHGRWYCGNA